MDDDAGDRARLMRRAALAAAAAAACAMWALHRWQEAPALFDDSFVKADGDDWDAIADEVLKKIKHPLQG